MIKDLWYKNAIVYCLDVKTFMDSNGDGVGDFEGLSRRLAYLAGLGVTAVWLLPFCPSPMRDNGYDITPGTDPCAASCAVGGSTRRIADGRPHSLWTPTVLPVCGASTIVPLPA